MYYLLSNIDYPVLNIIPTGSRIIKYIKNSLIQNTNYAYVHIFEKLDDGTYVFLFTKKNEKLYTIV